MLDTTLAYHALPLDRRLELNLRGPAPLFVSGEDSLRLSAFNALAGVRLQLAGRHLTLDNEVRPFTIDLAPTSDRVITHGLKSLGDGWLMHLTVVVDAGAPLRGQTYARVQLVRGLQGPLTVLGTLAADYVTVAQPLAWPFGAVRSPLDGPGAVRSVLGSDPAAAAEILETVPTGARWKLHAIRAALVTDANAANRFVNWQIDDGTTLLYSATAAAAQAASLTRQHVAAIAGFGGGTGDITLSAPLPSDLVLLPGWRILTVTTNIQAGDNYGAPQLTVEEWLGS